jgi:hypothetical protein
LCPNRIRGEDEGPCARPKPSCGSWPGGRSRAPGGRHGRRHHRQGLLASPPHLAELVEALDRECLLLVATRLDALLARRLARPRAPRGRADAALADVFREEFLRLLTRARGWGAGEVYEFRRDLVIYAELAALLETQPGRPKPRKLGTRPAGPFVDRCALLLDPSLFEKARGAAARLETELLGEADALLVGLLRRRSR